MSASDIDTGNNARITYRIIASIRVSHKSNVSSLKIPIDSAAAKLLRSSANATDIFGIYPHNGWIYLRNALDRETCDMYDVTVLASDNGTPIATAEAHVIVSVLDANDNSPIFTRESYEFSVEENVARNTILGTISATDADLENSPSSEIRYTLLTNNTNFHINSKSGKNFVQLAMHAKRIKTRMDFGRNRSHRGLGPEEHQLILETNSKLDNFR